MQPVAVRSDQMTSLRSGLVPMSDMYLPAKMAHAAFIAVM